MAHTNPDVRALDTFLAVCQHGTMARAAAHLNRTQPAVTYQIRRLEEDLGVRLFERHGRALLLSTEGRRLRKFAERQAEDFRVLLQSLTSHPAAEQTFTIASVSGFGRYVLYPVIRKHCLDQRLVVTLLFRSADDVFRMVDAGDVDCGVVYRPKVSSRLNVRPIYREELVLIVPHSLEVAAPSLRQLAAFTRIPFVTYEESDYVFGRWFHSQFRRQPATGVVAAHFTELEEVIDSVAQGVGASIVPRDAVPTDPRLRIIHPFRRLCVNDVFSVTRTGSRLSAVAQAILDTLSASKSH